MTPRIRLLGLPLHPLLVHFPIAFWLLTPVFDVAALSAGPGPWWKLGFGATMLGIVIGALAIGAGLLKYPHMFQASELVLVNKIDLLPLAQWSMVVGLVLGLLGCALLVQGIYFGTRQVYEQLEKD